MRVLALLALCVAVVARVPSSTRLAGGNFVNISRYPSLASLTVTWNGVNHNFQCAAVLINNRSAVTAAHCVYYSPPNQFRLRVGSSYVNSGGVMHNVNSLRYHPNYSDSSYRYDVGLVRTSSNINQNNNVRPAPIAGSNYNLGNNQNVWATGWRHSSGSNNNRQIADSRCRRLARATLVTRESSPSPRHGLHRLGQPEQQRPVQRCVRSWYLPLRHSGRRHRLSACPSPYHQHSRSPASLPGSSPTIKLFNIISLSL
uniref:HSUP59 n=1 Tax=Trichoplusia ni TaxID=7111 RepID=Q26331_TRINI|nr:HSUP59 [Trichoplusia ni]